MPVLTLRIYTDHMIKACAFDRDVVRVGRDSGCDVCIPDARVSRTHVLFERQGATYRVVDNGSYNGTVLNGQRIESANLESGDSIRLGDYTLWIEVLPEDQASDTDDRSLSAPGPTIPTDR